MQQFKRLANLWFLIVAVIQVSLYHLCTFAPALLCSPFDPQLIPGVSPLNPASSIVPLVFVLLVTAVKEAFEDIVRPTFFNRLLLGLGPPLTPLVHFRNVAFPIRE